jgi:4-amino-4-deoxy-L-arabinose transferase-like glycosyltransferase
VPAVLAVESRERQNQVDVPTLIALSTVAWALADVLHEVVGHAGAAVLVGVSVRAVSTTTVFIPGDQIHSLGDVRTIHAAATVLNLVTGGLALLALRSRWVTSSASRYFLWIFATISFIIATLNFLAGADWAEVTTGLEPRGLWRAGVVAVGLLVAVAGYVLPLRLWMPDLRKSRGLQLKITAIPVAVLIVVQTLSVVRSPFAARPIDSGDNALMTVVALFLFFGLWLALVNLVPRPRSTAPVESIRLTRSKGWLAVGLIVLLVFVAVLGPGLGPLEDDPRLT